MDKTYVELSEYIEDTEKIATMALQNIDKNAEFHIIPSLDLGIPYDVDRLAGGFPAGAYIYWRCKEPIIPIDTTVNCCSASIFSLGKGNLFDEQKYIHELNHMKSTWENSSYILNFDKGNHFISLCIDEDSKYYLIMHSTAKEFTKGYNGLYPIKGNWYYDKIKTYQFEKRYFRYISGKEAVNFSKTAKFLNQYNEIRHENIAYSLLEKLNIDVVNVSHFHHYGMENDNSIKIGCYTVEKNDVFPIFSKPSYAIDLFQIQNSSRRTEDGKHIVPHGWGKHMTAPLNIDCDFNTKQFYMGEQKFSILAGDNFYRLSNLLYRDYELKNGKNGFYDYYQADLEGKVLKRLYQKICISSGGINIYSGFK